ncbi:formate dehydrogenase accessory sulfurtransferase FdhD [Neiella sp. HB171785]|uniref:Sulfur carrier protein FdhD n=1 Tax=Neiella litorisoli TaxID=2771431 RepID=A0A8J6QTX7_9GAMM|nr:formate dehydrogenase accessory sulfurtransferase FdhD [Neiella litorisoli]MBD1388363.1 formate dehydrogenase accessory sulfurtransferase FdhD [Neiella litorisoli]
MTSVEHKRERHLHLSHLPEEVALALNINGINYAVMLASPDDIEDFVVGFLFSEQLICHNRDVHDIDIVTSDDQWQINVQLANRCITKLNQRTRNLRSSASCGLCGITALQQAFPELPKVSKHFHCSGNTLTNIRAAVANQQVKSAQTGAQHGACLLLPDGAMVAVREDIGRHNALDKLVGYLLRQPQMPSSFAIVITSRCGIELVQKAIQINCPCLISLASPSKQAVQLAQAHGLQLIHIPKFDGPISYQGESHEL